MPAVIQSVDYSPLPIWPETGAAVMKAWPKGPVAAHIAYARWRSALIDHAERAWQRNHAFRRYLQTMCGR